jgi:hypothetical protein
MDLEVMVFSPLKYLGMISACENTVASSNLICYKVSNSP